MNRDKTPSGNHPSRPFVNIILPQRKGCRKRLFDSERGFSALEDKCKVDFFPGGRGSCRADFSRAKPFSRFPARREPRPPGIRRRLCSCPGFFPHPSCKNGPATVIVSGSAQGIVWVIFNVTRYKVSSYVKCTSIHSTSKKHTESFVGVKKTGKGRRKLGRKKRRNRARIRHRK